MRKLFAFDLVFLGYLAVVGLIVLAVRPPGWGIYLAYHAAAAGMVLLLAHAHDRYGGRFWKFARYWYVVPVVLGAFRELHYLLPGVHPFNDHRYDRELAEIDRKLFGDVDGFFLSAAQPQFVDFLHACYWSYFVLVILPGAVLYFKGDLGRLREYVSAILASLFISYLGYFVVPAIGPHHFMDPRPAALDGWLIGGLMHRTLMAIEWRMADAFPSGHALLSMTVLVMCWRLQRATFWGTLVPALAVVWATMALRYHYVIDVVASVALLPVVIFLGLALNRWRENA